MLVAGIGQSQVGLKASAPGRHGDGDAKLRFSSAAYAETSLYSAEGSGFIDRWQCPWRDALAGDARCVAAARAAARPAARRVGAALSTAHAARRGASRRVGARGVDRAWA